MSKQTVFFIVGPTASGKTAAAVEAAKALNCDVVSADAIQIYRGLEIGSAKPTIAERQGIAHHLLDVTDYTDASYNVARYHEDAVHAIDSIVSRERTPLVAGGTGLYVNSLVYPLDFTAVPPDDELRKKLLELESADAGCLYKRLSAEDPKTAARLHPNDTKRIIRAIEVAECAGATLSELGGDFTNVRQREIDYRPVMAGLTCARSALYERINRRVDIMIERGLVDEVRGLIKNDDDVSLPSLQAIGYKQLIGYFNGEYTLDAAIDMIKRETRRFAKRQISWFKRDTRIHWFDSDAYESANELHKAMINYFSSEAQND